MTVPQQQIELAERLRALLVDEQSTREVSMFGGRSFMVNEKMIASAWKNGDLLVRVSRERHSELVKLPGAATADMGAGRTMGPGWISVVAPMVTEDEQLSFWVGVALEHRHAGDSGGH